MMRWLALLLLTACAQAPVQTPNPPDWARYENQRPVVIQGYDGDAMEPFLSRDGRALFFNNSNAPGQQTDLHWAERLDDSTFAYRGPVALANSAALDGVVSISADGRFCFISLRSYEETLGSVYCANWDHNAVSRPELQREVSRHTLGRVVFDLEISNSGDTLIVADGEFRGGPIPASADLRLARWRDGSFQLSPADDALFAAINTDALEYAAGLSADGLTLAFTRAEGRPPFIRTRVWIARRDTLDRAFGPPVRIDAIAGDQIEGPTFSPNGDAIYYHRRTNGRHSIWCVSR